MFRRFVSTSKFSYRFKFDWYLLTFGCEQVLASLFSLRLAKLFQQEFKVFIQRLKFGGRSIQSAPQLRSSSKMNEGNVDMLRLQMCSKSAEDVSLEDGCTLMCLNYMSSVCVQCK